MNKFICKEEFRQKCGIHENLASLGGGKSLYVTGAPEFV